MILYILKDSARSAYKGPVIAVEELTQKLKEFGYDDDVRILDLGCGTGLAGEELVKRGYTNIDGIDLNSKMLEIARQKAIYKSVKLGSMGSDHCRDLGVTANQYDAAICVGVFIVGHVKSKGFDDVIHVVRPGGLACFNMRATAPDDVLSEYQEKMKKLAEEGKWKLISKRFEVKYLLDRDALFYVYQIL